MKSDQLGNIYVRYLKPIILKPYLKEIGYPSIKVEEMNDASFKLTKKLYKRQ